MALEIVKTFEVDAAPEAVWSFLTDLPRVARCLPGAASGDKLDEKTSSGTMTIKFGPVSSTYRGKVVFERLDPAARTAQIVATGQDVRGKGGADLKLTSSLKALPGGKTEVTAVSLVNVTGMLAQMGRGRRDRLLADVAAGELDDLGEDAQRDLLGQPGADVQARGIPDAIQWLGRHAAREQALPELSEPRAAGDHAEVLGPQAQRRGHRLLVVLSHRRHDRAGPR